MSAPSTSTGVCSIHVIAMGVINPGVREPDLRRMRHTFQNEDLLIAGSSRDGY